MLTAQALRESLERDFALCGDFNLRRTVCGGTDVYLASLGNFAGRSYIADNILRPLASRQTLQTGEDLLSALCTSEVSAVGDAREAKEKVLAGAAVVFADVADGSTAVYACMARSDPARSVSEPNGEVVVRGPREGFVESAENNVALLRKRLRTEKMKVLDLSVGRYSGTSIKLVYLQGVADEALVGRIREKIERMELPSVMDSGYIEQYLTDGAPALFTEVGNSEKPDKVAAKLAEGRVAIVCDGSPVVLTVPYLFVESLQSAEDYLKTPYYATFIRIIRFVGLFLALYLPAFYIAMLQFHKYAVPHTLYEKIVTSRQDVPFSVFGELVVILLIFEIIREVGVRMPGAVGDAVSIVAGLVLGDAAVSAGISSAPVIMVASFTAICTFILPPYMNSTVLLRLVNTVLARLFGMVGIAVSVTVLLVHLCGKTSFGTPYLAPLAPLSTKGLADTLLSLPRRALKRADRELKG